MYRWENWLPTKGKLYEKSIEHLKMSGIVESGEKYAALARKLIKHLEDGKYLIDFKMVD